MIAGVVPPFADAMQAIAVSLEYLNERHVAAERRKATTESLEQLL